MKKFVLTLAMALVAVASFAYDAYVDGIYYNLVSKVKTAEVTDGDSKYSGSVVIPEQITVDGVAYSVTSIGWGAFRDCSGLTSVEIPNSVTSIGGWAFSGCSGLKNLTLGSGLRTVEQQAFAYCKELEEVICYAENVPTTSSDAFTDSYVEYATLMVPDASIEKYKATNPWSGFGSIVPLTDEEMDVKAPFADSSAPVVVFDLQGHRLAQPRKGLNIINGKKVLVK